MKRPNILNKEDPPRKSNTNLYHFISFNLINIILDSYKDNQPNKNSYYINNNR
jgi:hypothetical protein